MIYKMIYLEDKRLNRTDTLVRDVIANLFWFNGEYIVSYKYISNALNVSQAAIQISIGNLKKYDIITCARMKLKTEEGQYSSFLVISEMSKSNVRFQINNSKLYKKYDFNKMDEALEILCERWTNPPFNSEDNIVDIPCVGDMPTSEEVIDFVNKNPNSIFLNGYHIVEKKL